MKINHLVTFFGRHLLGSLTPVLDHRFEISQITLLCDSRQLRSCRKAASFLEQKGLTTLVMQLEDSELPGIVKTALDRVIHWHQTQPHLAQGTLLLNLAGANPIAACVGTQVFRQQRLPICCVTTHTDRLIWLSVPSPFPAPAALDLDNRLSLSEALALHGINIPTCWQWLGQRLTHWDQLCLDLVEEAGINPNAIARFGAHCRIANAVDLLTPSFRREPHHVRQLCSTLIKHGFARMEAGEMLRLDSAEVIDFVSGGWLEHFVLMKLSELQAKRVVQDAACGLVLEQDGITNELDGICIANNKIFILECKARKGSQRQGQVPVGIGPETIYKIDSIRAIRSFEAGAIVVTLAELSELEKARLDAEGIGALCWRDLADFSTRLEALLKS